MIRTSDKFTALGLGLKAGSSILSFIFVTLLNSVKAYAYTNINSNSDILDKASVAEIFDIGSGVFAVILSILSFIAYRNLKSKNLLLVGAAFGLFALHVVLSRIDFFIPTIESSLLELLVSMLSFVSLALFFLAIVKRIKIKSKPTTP